MAEGAWGACCTSSGSGTQVAGHSAYAGATFATAAVTAAPAAVAIANAAMQPGAGNIGFTHANGILTYTGTDAIRVKVTGHLTGTWATDANTGVQLYVLKNGAIVDLLTIGSDNLDNAAGGTQRQVSTSCVVLLAQGDFIQLGVSRGSAAGGNQALNVGAIVMAAVA